MRTLQTVLSPNVDPEKAYKNEDNSFVPPWTRIWIRLRLPILPDLLLRTDSIRSPLAKNPAFISERTSTKLWLIPTDASQVMIGMLMSMVFLAVAYAPSTLWRLPSRRTKTRFVQVSFIESKLLERGGF